MSDEWEGIKLPQRFFLKKGDSVVASLNLCHAVEMFWLGCDFNPTELFAEIPQVEWETQATASSGIRASYNDTTSGCTLSDPDNAVTFGLWIMHCVSENEVHIRFGEPMRQTGE